MFKNIKYFRGLNSLRFFAAYLVVLHHAEQIRMKYEMFNLKSYSLFNNGGLAVTFFFVLSGFLITYLLLKEQNHTSNISIRKFYVRRILRIWPLYFMLVLIGAVIIPYVLKAINNPYEMPYTFKEVILFYVFFTPFMVNIKFGHHLLEPLWSIGVEELFYIIWAPFFKFFKTHILKIIFAVIFIKLSLKMYINYNDIHSTATQILSMLQFEAMAIGGLGAYLLFHGKKSITANFLFSYPAQIILVLFIALRLFAYQALNEWSSVFNFLFTAPIISEVLLMFSFLWLIMNTSLNPKSLFAFKSKFLNFLGEISYGIYMYHMLIVFTLILISMNFINGIGNILGTAFFYIILTVGVIIVSYLSKILFEDQFLKLKKKFETLHS